jgi:hypothetical protein
MPELSFTCSRDWENKIIQTMPTKKTSKFSENEITQQIIEGLKYSGYRVFKQTARTMWKACRAIALPEK